MKTFLFYSMFIIILAVTFIGCSKKPGSVIKDFYAAKTWDEKKAFILNAEGLKSSDIYSEEATYDIKEITLLKKLSDNSFVYKVTLNRTENGKEEKRVYKFLIVKSGDTEKIDFKTMYRVNEINFTQFLDKQPSSPTKFWVKVYINIAYRDLYHQKVVSVYDGHETFSIAISDKKSSEDEKKIYEIALKGDNKMILIEVPQIVKFNNDYFITDVKFIKEYPIELDLMPFTVVE